MFASYLLFVIAECFNFDYVLIVYSNDTSPELFSEFKKFNLKVHVESDLDLKINEVRLIVDLTENSLYFEKLESISIFFHSKYLTLSNNCINCFSKNRYLALPSKHSESIIIRELIKFLGWKSYSLISDSSLESIELTMLIHKSLNISSSFSILNSELDDDYYNSMIKRLIKSSGIQNFFIIGSAEFLKNFQNLLILNKANKSEFEFLFSSSSSASVYLENSLILSLKDSNFSTNYANTKFLYLSYLINNFFKNSEINFFKSCENHNCGNQFELLRVKDSIKEKIAEISDKITIIDSKYSDNRQDKGTSQILIFIANGTNEGDSKIFPVDTSYYKGALYKIEKVNENEELKGFKYETLTTSCGNVGDDYNFTNNCLKNMMSRKPTAYLTNLYTFGAFFNVISLREMNAFIPQISPLVSQNNLDNKTLYPEYLTLATAYQDFYHGGQSYLLKNFGWEDVIVFASEDIYSIYTIIKNVIINSGTRILNPEKFAIFPAYYTRDDFEKYKEYFMFAKNKKCRIFFVLGFKAGLIVEGLYDVGYRKGDFISIWIHSTYTSILKSEINEKFLNKRKELLTSNLVITYNEWEGSIGLSLKSYLSKFYNDTTYMCLTHDAFLSIHTAIQHLIMIGEDFENSQILMQAMRNQRFMGCLGSLFIQSYSNQRSGVKYMSKQVLLNKTTNQLYLINLALVDRFAIKTTNFVNEPSWVDSEVTPSNYLDNGVCGFEPRLKRDSESGRMIIFIACSIIFLNTVIFSLISLRKFKSFESDFQFDKYIDIPDMIIFAFLLLEFFQIICLEPDDGIFTLTLNKINLLIGFRIQDYFNIEYENFWRFYIFLIVMTFFYGILTISLFLQSKTPFKYLFQQQKFLFLIEVIGIFYGNLFLLPINYILLEIINCPNSIGDSIYSSFFERDCTQLCYQGKHKTYFILGIICLFVYSSTSTFMRPYWEITLTQSNLRTKTAYSSMLTCFQVLLVVIKKSVQYILPGFEGFLMSGVLLIFLILSILVPSYNLKRVSVYQKTVIAMSFWSILLSNLYVSIGGFGFVILCYMGLLIILLAGVGYSLRFESGFKVGRGVAVSNLIRFQFSKNFEALFNDTVFKSRNLRNE